MTANVIVEKMLSVCNSGGHHFQLLGEITEHKRDFSDIRIITGLIRPKNGNQVPKKTTRGWKLLVEWKYGTVGRVSLKDFKESNPIRLSEYALENGIEEEPAFKRWAIYVLRRRDRIISKVKEKYWRKSNKFGIRVLKTVTGA